MHFIAVGSLDISLPPKGKNCFRFNLSCFFYCYAFIVFSGNVSFNITNFPLLQGVSGVVFPVFGGFSGSVSPVDKAFVLTFPLFHCKNSPQKQLGCSTEMS
jgi:hypothetical protein